MSTEASIVTHRGRKGTAPRELGFERFFRLNYPVVIRIANNVVGDSHLAQDVAQEVFIAAQRRFREPEGSDHAVAWVRTAAATRRRGQSHSMAPQREFSWRILSRMSQAPMLIHTPAQ